MIIILGLVILIAALVVGVAGVLGNGGSAHPVSHFPVLGYHPTGLPVASARRARAWQQDGVCSHGGGRPSILGS
jgi:hypothetical protein